MSLPYYAWFQRINAALAAGVLSSDQLAAEVQAVAAGLDGLSVQGGSSIAVTGSPEDGWLVSLQGDATNPGAMKSYATNNTGVRGWYYPSLFESTGLLAGCALSVQSSTQVRIAAGLLGFADYTASPANPVRSVLAFPQTDVTITAIASQPVTYLAVDSAGAITQQATPLTNTQRRTLVPVGVAVHTNLSSINTVNSLPAVVRAGIAQLLDYLNYRGRLHKGLEYAANGANLQLNRSAGTIFAVGGNFHTSPLDPNVISLSGQTGLTFRYRTSAGEPAGDVTNVASSTYNPTGSTLTAVPSNDWTVQRIYVFPSGLTRIQYGQATYPNLAAAIAGWQTEAFITETNLADNGVPVGLIFVKEGATDLSNPAQAKFQPLAGDGVPAAPSVPLADTDDLAEGTTNLYYTDARTDARIQAFQDAPSLTVANLQNAVDDTAAATAGVAVGGLYRNGSLLMIRVT